MNCFFKAKIPSFCVANFKNSGLFSAICALNLKILSLEKFNPDLFRASLDKIRSEHHLNLQRKHTRFLSSCWKISVLFFMSSVLLFSIPIPESQAEVSLKHFQFDRLNQDYKNIAPKIKEVQSGPLIIRLSSPKHLLTLHSHALEILRGKDDVHQIQLSAEIEGGGQLLAEIDLFGLGQTIKDRFQIPRQKKQLSGKIRVDREAAGYRITPVKIPKNISVIIHSELGKQLVLWCKALPLALMDCDDLDRMLSKLTLTLPQDKPFFIKNVDLRSEERAVLDQYIGQNLSSN